MLHGSLKETCLQGLVFITKYRQKVSAFKETKDGMDPMTYVYMRSI